MMPAEAAQRASSHPALPHILPSSSRKWVRTEKGTRVRAVASMKTVLIVLCVVFTVHVFLSIGLFTYLVTDSVLELGAEREAFRAPQG